MRKNLTEIVFILDKSGSMHGLESDTVGGFNSMIKEQKKEEGQVLVTSFLFNDKIKLLHDRQEIDNIESMTENDYRVGGCTALLDAIGEGVEHIEKIHKYARKEDLPEHTLFIITTDGMENASRKYSIEDVRAKVEKAKEELGWEFLFLGANIDAIETAGQFGIGADRAVNYKSDSLGTELNFKVLNQAAFSLRLNKGIGANWKSAIDEDYKKRG